MTAVGVQDAASRLPHLIKLAAADEQILITDGDRPVAVLGPPPKLRRPCPTRGNWSRRCLRPTARHSAPA